MKIKVVVHAAEEGGFWAEVPAIPGCATQGETIDELLAHVSLLRPELDFGQFAPRAGERIGGVNRYGREFCYCLGLAATAKKLTRPIFCASNHR
jgi:hypothetical protein